MIFESTNDAYTALSEMNDIFVNKFYEECDEKIKDHQFKFIKKYSYVKSIKDIFLSMVKLKLVSESEAATTDDDVNRLLEQKITSIILSKLPNEDIFQDAVKFTICAIDAPASTKANRKILAKRKSNNISNVSFNDEATNIEENEDVIDATASTGEKRTSKRLANSKSNNVFDVSFNEETPKTYESSLVTDENLDASHFIAEETSSLIIEE
jgi:hypothetical protein